MTARGLPNRASSSSKAASRSRFETPVLLGYEQRNVRIGGVRQPEKILEVALLRRGAKQIDATHD